MDIKECMNVIYEEVREIGNKKLGDDEYKRGFADCLLEFEKRLL
jgi:hypothetical protein